MITGSFLACLAGIPSPVKIKIHFRKIKKISLILNRGDYM